MEYFKHTVFNIFIFMATMFLVSSCALMVTESESIKPNARLTIKVDNTVEYQTMEGFGATTLASVNFTGEGVKDVLSPVLRKKAIKAVYSQVGLTMGNLELWHEPVNDDDNPRNFNWSRFMWDSHDAMHDLLVKPAIEFGFNNYSLGLKVNTRWSLKWLNDIRANDYENYLNEVAEYVVSGAIYWQSNFGITPKYIMLFNEPLSGNRELSDGSRNEIVDIVKYTGERLRSEGFNEVKFIVPGEETVQKSTNTSRAILTDPKAKKYVGAVAYHAYPYDSSYSSVRRILETSGSGRPDREEIRSRQELKELGKKYNLPVWMTEISEGPGNANFKLGAIENLRARVVHIHDELVYANASAYFGMNNMWDRYSHDSHFNNRTTNFLTETSSIVLLDQKESQVHITGMGFAVGHYARWVKRGAVRIEAVSDDPLVLVTAFRDDINNRLILVVINNSDISREITVRLKDIRITGPVIGELSSDAFRWERYDDIKFGGGNRLRFPINKKSVITVSAPLSG